MSTLGNCQVDNQGNPIPSIGGTCNLAGMHLDAQTISTPDPTELYGNGLVNNGMLDWEFYGVKLNPSPGAQPASQNDVYGNMYSLASYYDQKGILEQENQPSVVGTTMIASECNCNGTSKNKNQLLIFALIVVAAYLTTKL